MYISNGIAVFILVFHLKFIQGKSNTLSVQIEVNLITNDNLSLANSARMPLNSGSETWVRNQLVLVVFVIKSVLLQSLEAIWLQ